MLHKGMANVRLFAKMLKVYPGRKGTRKPCDYDGNERRSVPCLESIDWK
jgi:hypothetical protein